MDRPIENNKIRHPDLMKVIDRRPPWLVRYGLGMLAIMMIAGIISSYFILVPDSIRKQDVILSEHAEDHLKCTLHLTSEEIKHIKPGLKVGIFLTEKTITIPATILEVRSTNQESILILHNLERSIPKSDLHGKVSVTIHFQDSRLSQKLFSNVRL